MPIAKPRGQSPAKDPLFLAFLNTVEDDGKTRAQNSFGTARDLVATLQSHGLDPAHPVPNSAQMATLLSLRDAGYAVLSALAAGRKPGREEALHLEMVMKSALQDARFHFDTTGLQVQAGPLGGIQDELALSLAALLQSPQIDRLRECKRCTHMFLDHGRGPGRRWCSMARCGNRAKSEAFRQRHRAEQGRTA